MKCSKVRWAQFQGNFIHSFYLHFSACSKIVLKWIIKIKSSTSTLMLLWLARLLFKHIHRNFRIGLLISMKMASVCWVKYWIFKTHKVLKGAPLRIWWTGETQFLRFPFLLSQSKLHFFLIVLIYFLTPTLHKFLFWQIFNLLKLSLLFLLLILAINPVITGKKFSCWFLP